MTSKEILAGLTFRMKQLEKELKMYNDNQEDWDMINEANARLEEVASIAMWVKENQND